MTDYPADGLGTQLRRLLELLDGDLDRIYREDHPFYTSRFTPVMKALAANDHLTIKDIAAMSSVSHSAASQTVARLSDSGLVELTPDTDRRSRRATLTREGRRLLPWLGKRWRATDAAARELDAALSYPLGDLVRQAIEALEARPFSARIRAHESADAERGTDAARAAGLLTGRSNTVTD